MIYVIHYQNHPKCVVCYAEQAVFAKKVIIDQMLVNVFYLNNVVVKMKNIKPVVRLVLKHVSINLTHVQKDALLDVSVIVLIMFVKAILLVVPVLNELIVRKKCDIDN
jgi:hypothetical protein